MYLTAVRTFLDDDHKKTVGVSRIVEVCTEDVGASAESVETVSSSGSFSSRLVTFKTQEIDSTTTTMDYLRLTPVLTCWILDSISNYSVSTGLQV